jgi:hypothetical protein
MLSGSGSVDILKGASELSDFILSKTPDPAATNSRAKMYGSHLRFLGWSERHSGAPR